jgi:hypothetical protein
MQYKENFICLLLIVCGTENGTQALVHARQAFSNWAVSPAWREEFKHNLLTEIPKYTTP